MRDDSVLRFPVAPPDPELLERFLAGACSDEECARVQAWAGTTSRGTPVADAVRTSLREALRAHSLELTDPEEYRIALRRRLQNGSEIRPTYRSPRTSPQRPWAVAMMVMVTIVGVAAIVMPRIRPERGATRTYTTTTGQRTTITLSDGSRVTLAPDSHIRLVGFGDGVRTVEVDGEAYFDVATDSRVPFLVRSGGTTTQVLGTAFLVRHYTGDPVVHVAVANGKVRVGAAHTAATRIVAAGNAADMSDSTIVVVPIEDFAPEVGWVSGQLAFHNTPLTEVLAVLSRWYGYQFRVNDPSLTQERVTAVLSTTSSAAALANLEQILSVGLTVVGDTVTLTPRQERPHNSGRPARTYEVWTPTREVGR